MEVNGNSTHFLDFTNLSDPEWNLFCQSKLDYKLKTALKLLERRIGPTNSDVLFSSTVKLKLNTLIQELLTFIGKHSNNRIKNDPYAQNAFFRKPDERETFSSHLAISMWESRKSQVLSKKGNNIKLNSEIGEVFSKGAFALIPYSNKITFTKSKLTDTEMRSIGLIYMVNLVWLMLKETHQSNNANQISNLTKLVILMSGLLEEPKTLLSRSTGEKRKTAKTNQILEQIEKTHKSLTRSQKIAKAKAVLAKEGLKAPSGKTFYRYFTQNKKK